MKHKNLTGKIRNLTTMWIWCASVICTLPVQTLAADEAAKKDEAAATEEPAATEDAAEEEVVTNWANFMIGGVATNGNDAAFQQRAGQSAGLYGGIGSMRWEKEIDDMTLLIEGHALVGSEDYDATVGLIKEDLGYVKGGFKQFRTWYDGSGGFVPGVPGAWIPLYDDDLSVDRGKLWFEAGLRMEKLPEITFGYAHEWRDGTKDSTVWGQSGLSPTDYGIVPTLYNIDERRDTFTLDIAHTLGNTDLGLGLRYENVSNEDSKVIHNMPGSAFPTEDRTNTQTEVYDSDLFGAHIFSETRFNDRMLMSFGYAFTTMDTDTNGSNRTVVDRDGTPGPTMDHAFNDLVGGGQLSLNVANANFWWNPIDDLVIVPSFRAEWEDQSAVAAFLDEGTPAKNSSDSEIDKLTEQIEVRYTGLDNLVLYTKVECTQADGSILYRDINDGLRRQTSDIAQEKYVLGANWYPLKGLSFAAQYYHRDFDEDFDNTFTPDSFGGNSFDALLQSHDSKTDDANLRLTWRAMPNLTLVSRYDYQQSTVDNQGIDATGLPLATVESADITRHIFSQSATWLPIEQAYVQGSISYVLADTDTPANIYAPFRMADSDNDYVTASLTFGYALDKKTDIQASYSYYYSNNYAVTYDPATGAPGSVPFGSDAEEHLFSLSLNRRISPSMIWNVGYGFYTSDDDASGGYNDFDAHMVSTGLQVRF